MPSVEDVDDLKARIARLEKPRKDRWDRVQAIATLLVPVVIAVAANRFTTQMKEAELAAASLNADAQRQLEETRGDRDFAIATTNARISQGDLLRTLLDDLVSADPRKQKLASEVVLVALPEAGPRLLKALEESGSAETRQTAAAALDSRRAVLVSQFFAESRAARQAAYESLLSGWSDDSSIVPELIANARDRRSNDEGASRDGIYNTLVFLSHMNRESLRPHVDEIRRFSQEMEALGPRTKARAEVLRSRLPG